MKLKQGLLMLLAVLLPLSAAAIPESAIPDVKVRIEQAAGIKMEPIRIIGNDTAYGPRNGYAEYWYNRITLTEGYIAYFRNVDEAAGVIAHETCHILSKDAGALMRQEVAADICGRDLMVRAGYNPQAVYRMWLRILSEEGDAGPPTHPLTSKRAEFYRTGNKDVYK